MAFFEKVSAPKNYLAEGLYKGLGLGFEQAQKEQEQAKKQQATSLFIEGMMKDPNFQKASTDQKVMMILGSPLDHEAQKLWTDSLLEEQRNEYKKMTMFTEYSKGVQDFVKQHYHITDMNPYQNLDPAQKEEIDYIYLKAPQLGAQLGVSPSEAVLLARDQFVKEKALEKEEQEAFQKNQAAQNKERQGAIKAFQNLGPIEKANMILAEKGLKKADKVNAFKNMGLSVKEALAVVEGRTNPEEAFKGKKDPASQRLIQDIRNARVKNKEAIPIEALSLATKAFNEGRLLEEETLQALQDLGVPSEIIRISTGKKRKATEQEREKAYSKATQEEVNAYLDKLFLEE